MARKERSRIVCFSNLKTLLFAVFSSGWSFKSSTSFFSATFTLTSTSWATVLEWMNNHSCHATYFSAVSWLLSTVWLQLEAQHHSPGRMHKPGKFLRALQLAYKKSFQKYQRCMKNEVWGLRRPKLTYCTSFTCSESHSGIWMDRRRSSVACRQRCVILPWFCLFSCHAAWGYNDTGLNISIVLFKGPIKAFQWACTAQMINKQAFTFQFLERNQSMSWKDLY